MPDPEPEMSIGPDDAGRRFVEDALRALDGDLGPDGEAAFRARLAADAEARRVFVRVCLQTQALTEVLGPGRRGAFPEGIDPSDETAGRGSRPPLRAWLPWAITAAACLSSLLIIGAALGGRPAVVNPPESLANTERRGDRRVGPDFENVATVVKLDGARWDPADGPAPAGGDLLGARRLRLGSGRATLAFLSGVTLTLEGPADLDLVSSDRVFCRQGRLRARVPEGAEGFVVASPNSAVVDMGTEFGLNVEAGGRSRVMVFEGKAEAALLNPAGVPERTQLVERGKAFDLDPEARTIVATGARPEGFVGAPALSFPPLVLDPSYAAAVLKSGPRGYWRFESLAGGAIPDEVAGGRPLRVSGPVEVGGGSSGNGYAVFKAGEPGQLLFTDGLWRLLREPGHAVEFWFASEGISHASLVGLLPALERPNNNAGQRRYVHSFFVELTARDRQSLYKPGSVRFLHRWPLDITIGDNLVSETVYVPRRWHHVVAQKNGDRMELYFDGVPDRSMPLGPDHPTLDCRLVVGRRTPDPLDGHDRRPFVGRLDELAIYDHPLPADEVFGHFRSAVAPE